MSDDDNTDRFNAREVWDKDGVQVSVRSTSPGGVQFDIRELNPISSTGPDREYAIRVSGDDTWDLISALGSTTNEPVDLIASNIDAIMRSGVAAWLESIGIDPGRRYPVRPHVALVRSSDVDLVPTECRVA